MYKVTSRIVLLLLIIVSSTGRIFPQRTLVDTDPLHLFKEAVELYENEKYSAALEAFTEFLNSDKSYLMNAESWYRIAMSAKNTNLKSTEDLFAYYLEKYPEQNKVQTIYFQLGKYTYNNRNYVGTVYWLQKIQNPKYFDIPVAQEYFFMLGYSAYKTENYLLGLKCFSELDTYDNPYFNTANFYKGYIYYKQDRYKEALDNFLKVKDIQKLSDIIPVYITHIYLRIGDFPKVIDYGEKALKTANNTRKNDILGYMAEACFKQKNFAKTIEIYKQLEDKGVSFEQDEKYYYGYALFNNQDYVKSITYLSEIPLLETAFGQNVAYNLGIAYQKTGANLKALNLFGFSSKLSFDKEIQEQSYLNYAKISYQLNSQKEAISTLKEFIRLFPNSPNTDDAKTLLSQFLLASSNYKEALDILEAIPDKNYDVKNTYQQINYFYGLELFKNKKYDEAKEKFNVSLKNEINPKYSALSYFWIGECDYRSGNLEDALKNYKNFLYLEEARKTPYYSLGYYNVGYTYYKLEKYQDARSAFVKYTDLEENNKRTERYYDAAIRLADCNLALRDNNKALFYYNLIINNGYQDIDYALYQKAIILGLQNKSEDKIGTLNTIIEKYPNSAYVDDASYEIANVYFQAGKFANALPKFISFTGKYYKSSYYTSALLKTGICYTNLNNDDKALEQFKLIIKDYPYSEEAKSALSALSEIYTESGRGKELIEYLKTIPNLKMTASFQDSAMYNAAFSYVKKNNCDEAIKAMDNYLKSYPSGYFSVNAHYYLANCALYMSYKDLALTHFEAINEMGFNEFFEKSLKNASELYFSFKKDYANAAKRYKQLEETSGNKDNTLLAVLGLMRCYNKLEDYEQSKVYAEKLVSLPNASPENKTEAQYCIGMAHYYNKSYDLALAAFKLVSEKNKGDIGAESTYLSANIYYTRENYNEAINQIMAIRTNYPNSDYFIAKGFILLSDVFVKTGDEFQAKHTLESVIKNCEFEDLVAIAKQKLQNINLLEEQKSKTDSLKVKTDGIEIKQEDIK